MRKRKRCKHCQHLFIPCPQVPHQAYCSQKKCQRARKQDWNRKKLSMDSDYRSARQEAQKRWSEKNPEYWKAYRDRKKDYVARNREGQIARNQKRKLALTSQIVKTDESTRKTPIISGRYLLIPVLAKTIVKTDESIVEIRVLEP